MPSAHGFKISSPGESVLTQVDRNLRFHSQYANFKIYTWDDTSFTTNGSGDGSVTIPHNLGYAPAHLVFRKGTAQWTFLAATEYTNAFFPLGTPNQYFKNENDDLNPTYPHVGVYADDTNLYIVADGAEASTFMEFRYYLLADLSEVFSGNGGPTVQEKFGFKVSKPGIDVVTAKEYELGYSSKYKALQYFEVSKKKADITLPAMFASYFDNLTGEASYIDFEHGLGYPPLFFAEAIGDDHVTDFGLGEGAMVPYSLPMSDATSGKTEVSGFCDATRIRLYWYRLASYNTTTHAFDSFTADTITIKLHVFTQNLLGDAYP